MHAVTLYGEFSFRPASISEDFAGLLLAFLQSRLPFPLTVGSVHATDYLAPLPGRLVDRSNRATFRVEHLASKLGTRYFFGMTQLIQCESRQRHEGED